MRGRGEAEGTRALSLFFRRRLLGLLPPPSCLLGPYVSLLTYWFPPIISFFLGAGLFVVFIASLLFPSFLPVLYHLLLLISLSRLPSPRAPDPRPFSSF